MSKPSTLPEDAQEEPRTLSPSELADQGEEAQRAAMAAQQRGERPDTAAADNPLRVPGELASRARPQGDGEDVAGEATQEDDL
jgi:hypothetical protein